ncbi:MAG: ABC transporter permease [Lachnospiraceae bacterium]|nr:ABC transporter permease [Lachnospiraceae bacterium]MDY5522053.1 ABC transporter permease [Agathobacter sp.]
MNKNLYRKLAWQNIKNNKNTFGPFGICTGAMTAMFYMLTAIVSMSEKSNFYGDDTLNIFLRFGIIVTGIFAFFVILYTNSFLMKRRAKEFGLYSMLGMEKHHICKIIFWEMLDIAAISIGAGVLIGMLFSRLMFLLLGKLVGIQSTVAFSLSVDAIVKTLVVFVLFFFVAIVLNFVRIARLKPIELMRSTKAGEREPKAKWLMAILGVLCLGGGYYLSVSVSDPVTAISTFFIAVLLVIAGTYLLFISGSIALLKLLKNSKHFYYKKNHFVTVSGLMYRMKQNAAGLASICVLSTAVLVTLFSTVALYVGTEDCIRTMYPTDVSIQANPKLEFDDDNCWTIAENVYETEEFECFLDEYAASCNVDIADREHYYLYLAIGVFSGSEFQQIESMSGDMSMVFILSAEDYKNYTGREVDLKSGEALVYSKKNCQFPEQKMTFGDKTLTIVGTLPDDDGMTNVQYLIDDFLTIVVSDMDEISAIDAESQSGNLSYDYNFNLTGEKADIIEFCDTLDGKMKEAGYDAERTVSDIHSERQDYMGLYGSLFFIGIFIGVLFMGATVMIIYYKQISEGYDDRERFVIMQKVGMSEREIKGTIRSQILLVFFLPILLALLHISFAFPAIRNILRIFGLVNIPLLVGCLVVTVAVYVIGYAIVYGLTARTYYKIVK